MSYLFTSESVSEGHPDKIADQISDAILDSFLLRDSEAKVACETLVTSGLVIVGGEITSKSWVDIHKVVRNTIKNIGYNKSEYKFDAESCAIISTIHEQSPDIFQGVAKGRGLHQEQGAGDQGIMFGFACDETEELMPLPITLSHMILKDLSKIRKSKKSQMKYLRPDSKCQVTVEYDKTNQPKRIHTIVISTQHDENINRKDIENDIKNILIKNLIKKLPNKIKLLFDNNIKYHINPTGKFVIGGPHGDTGLTGRKIIVDTYGGSCAHGGGAFSGKDPSKVDRSAAYATRYIAKNLVAAGISKTIQIQVSYAIGYPNPVNIHVDTFGTSKIKHTDSEIASIINNLFDLRPDKIIEKFKLKDPIYFDTASYGHMGRKSFKRNIEIMSNSSEKKIKEIELFPWEKVDSVDLIKRKFKI